MLQIPVMIKHTAVLLIWFGYCSLPSFSSVMGAEMGFLGKCGAEGLSAKGMSVLSAHAAGTVGCVSD